MHWRRFTASLTTGAARGRARLNRSRAAHATAAATVLAAGISAALVLPPGSASGQVTGLMIPQAQAAPVTYALPGSPAQDKSLRASTVAALHAAHEAHLAHEAHIASVTTFTVAASRAVSSSTGGHDGDSDGDDGTARAAAAPVHASSHGSTDGDGDHDGDNHDGAVTASRLTAPSGGGSSSSGCSDPSGQLSPSQVGMLWVCAGGPSWARGAAEAVSHCESGWNTRAYNPSGATGLFQILGSVVGGSLWDAHVNALNAVSKFRASGDTWSQWVCKP